MVAMEIKRNKTKRKKLFLIILVFVFLLFDARFFSNTFAADSVSSLQDQLDALQKKREEEQKNLDQQTALYNQNQTKVNATRSLIQQTLNEISRKEEEIKNLNQQVGLYKTILGTYIQELYFSDNESPVIRLAIENQDLEGLFGKNDQLINTKSKILDLLGVIDESKNKIQQSQDELASKKQEHEKLLSQQQQQQNAIKSDINETQATLQDLNNELDKLRSQLSSLLGTNVSTDDIVKAAGIASKATGVRKDFILGALVVESNLGKFTGGCCYKKIGSCKDSRMGTTNIKIFLGIVDSLGYGEKMKVSCPLSYGIGGAMGVAQFMPTTWNGYKARIAAATGHNPPDPWDLVDGVTAMALYLKNRGADSRSGERNAAAAYYCGSNIGRAVCQNYAKKVLYWADNYEKLLD